MALLTLSPDKVPVKDSARLRYLRLELNRGSGIVQLYLRIPTYVTKVRVLDLEESAVQITDGEVWFRLADPGCTDDRMSRSTQDTAIAEASLIVDGFLSICRNALEKMEFTSLDEVPLKLAEIVLEVLDLPALNITLQKVKLRIRPVSDPRALYRGEASREQESHLNANQAQTKLVSTDSASHSGNEQNSLSSHLKDVALHDLGSKGLSAFQRRRLGAQAEVDEAEKRSSKMDTPKTTVSTLEPVTGPEASEQEIGGISEILAANSETTEQSDEGEAIQDLIDSRGQQAGSWRTAFIALGSNVGDRLKSIEDACREMDADPDIRITQTSPLYETDAMYVTDQDSFLNGACEVRYLKSFSSKTIRLLTEADCNNTGTPRAVGPASGD